MKTQQLKTQRGDTIHLQLPIPSDFRVDEDLFNLNIKSDAWGSVIGQTYSLTPSNKIHGLNKFNTMKHTSEIELEISAKILGDDYHGGITFNSISGIVDKINDCTQSNIKTDFILTQPDMRRFDNTFNIELDEQNCMSEYISALDYGSVGNSKLISANYNDESIVFRLDTKTTKNRMIFYNKLAQLQKEGKEFMKAYPNSADTFWNKLRVELNVEGMDKMRQNYKLGNGKVHLVDILRSKENAVLKNFARFVDIRTSQKYLFDYDTLFSMEIKHKAGMREKYFLMQHYKKYKGDADKVIKMYKRLYKDGKVPTDEKNKIKTYFHAWQRDNLLSNDRENYTKKFNEIHSKLKSL